MPIDALGAIDARNKTYKKNQRRAVKIFLFSVLNNVLLLMILIYLINHPPAPTYFPVTLDGHIVPLIPLSQPNLSKEEVLTWTEQAVVASYSYSFVNYREEIQAASGFFTPRGWTAFLNALQSSNNLEAVKGRRMVVSAQLLGAAQLEKTGHLGDSYAWGIKVPILATFQNNTEFTQQSLLVHLVIIRVSILNTPSGIGIEQMVVEPLARPNESAV